MTIATNSFEYVSELVESRSAILLPAGKEYLVEARLAPLARAEGLDDVEQLVDMMRERPYGELHRAVVEAMTTNETSFFRDPHVYDGLRDHVFPDLISKREKEHALHIWSAACSTGQEPYTMAMTLADSFPQLARWNVRIIATDINRQVLAQAEAGRYSQIEINRGLPARTLVQHFEKDGLEWCVKPDLRKMIEFRELNLANTWSGFPPLDLIMLRNVLIYFDADVKKRILQSAFNALRPDGYLVLGTAESLLGLDIGFERVDCGSFSAYRPKPKDIVSSARLGEAATGVWDSSLSADAKPVLAASGPWFTVSIGFNGAANGEFELECHPGLARAAAARLFGIDTTRVEPAQAREAAAEVAQMMAGAVKGAFPPPTILELPKVQEGLAAGGPPSVTFKGVERGCSFEFRVRMA